MNFGVRTVLVVSVFAVSERICVLWGLFLAVMKRKVPDDTFLVRGDSVRFAGISGGFYEKPSGSSRPGGFEG